MEFLLSGGRDFPPPFWVLLAGLRIKLTETNYQEKIKQNLITFIQERDPGELNNLSTRKEPSP